MEELAQWAEARHGVEVTVLPKDLSHPGAGGEVAEELAERGLAPRRADQQRGVHAAGAVRRVRRTT